MKTIWSLSCLVFLSASTLAVDVINDISIYKPCFPGGCDGEEVCFQYFCYPKSGMETPLRSCKKPKQCKDLGDYKCYKPSPTTGVCVPSADYDMCEGHDECEGRGGKCCGDYCCNEEYFQELQKKECSDDDEVCSEVQTVLFSIEMESLACESNEECEAKHTGHKCCSDNPLLKDVLLSDETLNWEGDKRCCFSATGERQLDEIENLTQEDYGLIDGKVSELPNKREFCKDLLKPLQDSFQTCIDEREAEAEEKRTEVAEAALAIAQNHAQDAADAKAKAVGLAESAKSASDSKEAQGYANDAKMEADNAQASANASSIAAGDAADAGSAGNAAVEAEEAASMAQGDADAADTAAADAQDAADLLKEAEIAAEKAKAEEEAKKAKYDQLSSATSLKVSTVSVTSALILYHLMS